MSAVGIERDMAGDVEFMRMAISKAREGIAAGQTPFGACIVRDGKVVALAHNTVWRDTDITAHAEMVAIRGACVKLGAVDLSGCTIYSTTEPCPMCFSAIHWARIGRIVFGTSIADACEAGFNELTIGNEAMARMGGSTVNVEGAFLRDECLPLFTEWKRSKGSRPY